MGTAALLVAPTGVFLAFVATYLTFEVHAIIMVFRCAHLLRKELCKFGAHACTPQASDDIDPTWCLQLPVACPQHPVPVPDGLPGPWNHPAARA